MPVPQTMTHKKMNYKPFNERSSKKRMRAYNRIKNEIRRSAPTHGGLFCTKDLLDGKNVLVDLYFLGNKEGIFYNLTLQTARQEYKEEVFRAAINAANALEAFDGLTRRQWIEREQARIADARTINVYPRAELRSDYAFGIGLHATIDVPFLTVGVIKAFIKDFLAIGERPWRDEESISFSQLTYQLKP